MITLPKENILGLLSKSNKVLSVSQKQELIERLYARAREGFSYSKEELKKLNQQ